MIWSQGLKPIFFATGFFVGCNMNFDNVTMAWFINIGRVAKVFLNWIKASCTNNYCINCRSCELVCDLLNQHMLVENKCKKWDPKLHKNGRYMMIKVLLKFY